MGGNHYYCDYCERSFKDAQGARKKHLDSIQHMKNRNEHYNRFKDPETILQEEQKKQPCMRFIKSGYCQFDSLCRYSHYTPEQLEYFKAVVAARKQQPIQPVVYDPDPQEIMKKFFEDPVEELEEIKDLDFVLWPAPVDTKDSAVVPPSLQPMTLRNFLNVEFPEWGQS